MNFNNFTVLVFHPNTEQKIVLTRDKLLEKKYKNFYPLFPLFAVNKTNNIFSLNKKDFSKYKSCSIEKTFEYQNILYFYGTFLENKIDNPKIIDSTKTTNNQNTSKTSFLIPVAIEKKTDDKSLSSVFRKAIELSTNMQHKNIDKLEFLDEKISFKSFQIANCSINNNQYSLTKSFWVKVIS